jgi:hypothetical protein
MWDEIFQEEEDEDAMPPRQFMQPRAIYSPPQYYQIQAPIERRQREVLLPDGEEFFRRHRHVHYDDQDVDTDPQAETETVSDLEDQDDP